MSKVLVDISMSLDGLITGPEPSVEQGLGTGGERLHEWVLQTKGWREPHGYEGGTTGVDSDLMSEGFARTGAVVIGRVMFDHAEGPWGDDPPFHNPVFVVTNRPREQQEKQGGTTYNFVDQGVEAAIEQAKAAAGDKDVAIGGGANIIQQCLKAGLVDEIQLHVVPVMLGQGRRLFDQLGPEPIEMNCTRVIESEDVTHLRYEIHK